MKYGNLTIEKREYVLLKRLMNLSGYYKDPAFKKSVKKLIGELNTAQILDEKDMPGDVVRFNSFMTITSKDGWSKRFQLVMPTDNDVKNNKISILTPMGAAVIGYAEGDSFTWEFPGGEQLLTVTDIEQQNKYIDVNILL